MEGKQRKFSPPVVGGSSLLVIFAVLCLTIFSLLSLSTVQADARLGEAAAQTISGYYQADCQAEEILARLRSGELPSEVSFSGNLYAYSCPVSDTQSLEVEVRLNGAEYEILRWQLSSTAQWEIVDDLELWDGAFPWD